MQAAQVSMARAGLSIAQQIFVLGFLQFLYWPPTISMALGQILAALPSTRRCRKVWQGSGLKTVVGVLRKARTDIVSNTNSMSIKCDGSGSHFLVAKPAVRSTERNGSVKFFHPRMNPSERRPGEDSWLSLESSASSWAETATCLAKMASGNVGSLCALVEGMRETCKGRSRYTGAPTDYSGIRFCRTVAVLYTESSLDSEGDWRILRGMGAGIKSACSSGHISDYEAAIRVRDLFSLHLPNFSLMDLACALCLGRSSIKEES